MGAFADSLAAKRIAVCVGAGGVGKTSLAAAIALQRALDGGKALVCTIDPARRLANALGLESLGNFEALVPTHRFTDAGLRPRGQLYAMMLDVKRTWDDLVSRHAPDRSRRERILQNRIYQQLSTALAGSQEYMAMEKLYELSTERDYDLVVLDTPPTSHALDFLEAPDRILDFLGNETARALLGPALHSGRMGLKLVQLGSSYVAKTLARFTGAEVLREIAELMSHFQDMYEGFKSRATAVRELLCRPEVGFVIVASPSAPSIEQALFFQRHLLAEGMPIAGVVANRVTPDLWPLARPLPSVAELAGTLRELGEPDGLAVQLADSLWNHQLLARADRLELARLFEKATGAQVAVQRLENDIQNLSGLAQLARQL